MYIPISGSDSKSGKRCLSGSNWDMVQLKEKCWCKKWHLGTQSLQCRTVLPVFQQVIFPECEKEEERVKKASTTPPRQTYTSNQGENHGLNCQSSPFAPYRGSICLPSDTSMCTGLGLEQSPSSTHGLKEVDAAVVISINKCHYTCTRWTGFFKYLREIAQPLSWYIFSI